MQVLCRYGTALTDTGSKLMIESASKPLQEQLRTAGVTDVVGPENIYTGTVRVGATLKRACADATAWISGNQHTAGTDTPG